MDINSSSPQQPTSRQPQPGMPPRPMQPVSRRPMVDGFAPRRPAAAIHGTPSRPVGGQTPRPMGGDVQAPRPTAAPQQATVSSPAAPLPRSQQPHPFATRPMTAGTPAQTARPADVDMPKMHDTDGMQPTGKSHAPRERSNTGHAGLAGFIALIVLSALFLLPLVPGKIFQNFPLTSSTLSTGNQSIDCLGTQGQIQNSTAYNTKAGSPLTYTYSTSTTQTATCNGQSQSAVVERASQFSPLALVLDVLLAVILAAITARVWRIVYTMRHPAPRSKTAQTKH